VTRINKSIPELKLTPPSRPPSPGPASPLQIQPSAEGDTWAPVKPPPTRPDDSAARALAGKLENEANDGRYKNRYVAAKKKKEQSGEHPLQWAILPEGGTHRTTLFAPEYDAEASKLSKKLFRTLIDPVSGLKREVALVPVHWEEAKSIQEKYPEVQFLTDGVVVSGASPRSLFVGEKPEHRPTVADVEQFSIKMHLSLETYRRMGGLGGNRDINFNDAKIATIIDHVFNSNLPNLSPYTEFQSEGRAIAAQLGEGENKLELGAIFRALSSQPVVPGFALYSLTRERLPHIPADFAPGDDKRMLARDAINYAMSKNPGLTKEDAFVKLFARPTLDVLFSMMSEGFSMELHAQNFQLRFSPHTGLTEKVVVRDLHGMNYSAAERARLGKRDLFSVENLKEAFPDVTQADVDGWFKRNGEVRDRYKAPAMYNGSVDFFLGMFFYHLLATGHESGVFSKEEVGTIIEKIKDEVEAKADEHNFDLGLLKKPRTVGGDDFWAALTGKNGIDGPVVFRRGPATVLNRPLKRSVEEDAEQPDAKRAAV
jgi:hypothetical protein